jgi:hypothetical protein
MGYHEVVFVPGMKNKFAQVVGDIPTDNAIRRKLVSDPRHVLHNLLIEGIVFIISTNWDFKNNLPQS